VTVVLVPMLGRPHTVQPLMESLDDSVDVLFICSPDDKGTRDACMATGADVLVVGWDPGPGDYAKKINAGYRVTDDPFLFLGACDLCFHPGWLGAASAKLGPDVGVVGTNDLGNPRVLAGTHSTHSLVTRDYADQGLIDGQPGILHEGYQHEFVDDELVGTAKKRGAWAFAAESVVEHLHPHWGKAPTDAIYDGQRERMALSWREYRTRRRLWM
jgi:hypothetical protein